MTLSVIKSGAACGAQIKVDLSAELDDCAFAEVERAFHDNIVVYFRDQRLSIERQIAFSRRLLGERRANFLEPLQISRRSWKRQILRQQEISRVSFGDGDHVTADAQLFYVFLQDDLHGISLISNVESQNHFEGGSHRSNLAETKAPSRMEAAQYSARA